MQHESFASPEVAAILNSSFIPIKVDRETRPDIDEIYMNYVTATTGSGGWPLNVFLTPDLDPVFGGTYWPGPGSNTLPHTSNTSGEDAPLNFLQILERMRDVWANQQERCSQSARSATQQLRDFAAEGTHSQSQSRATADSSTLESLEIDLLDDALSHFMSRYDTTNGGFALSPKFPTPPNIAFLLRIGASITTTSTRFGFPSPVPPILGKQGCTTAARMALHTLFTISRSALRDHLGHGFHRYSVTPDWNLPHFEKMLPDNAQLMSVYCDAWALSRDPEILGTIYSLVEYLTSPESSIISPQGAFYGSEDADSQPSKSPSESREENREGAFYVWTLKEFSTVLGDERDAAILARHFGVSAHGNVAAEHDTHDEFLTQNTLRIAATPSILAREFGLPEDQIVKVIKTGRAKLAEFRDKERAKPSVDTKIIAGWNALAVSALCRAANTLAEIDEGRSQRCKVAAEKAAAFIKENMYHESSGRLDRIFLANKSGDNEDASGFADDYAYMITACLSLYEITSKDTYLHWAQSLQTYLDMHFLDTEGSGGYFQIPAPSPTSATPSQHIVRLKPGTDTSLPSPNGVIAMNLLYLASYLAPSSTSSAAVARGKGYVKVSRETINAFGVEIIQHPFLFVTMLGAVVLDTLGVKGIVVQGEIREEEVRRLNGWGRTVVKVPFGSDIAGLEGNVSNSDVEKARVLICEGGVCRELVEGELDKGLDYYDDDDDEGATLEGESAGEKEKGK